MDESDKKIDPQKVYEILLRHYSFENYLHADRVSNNILNNLVIPKALVDDCYWVAWFHDIIEDSVNRNSLEEDLEQLPAHIVEAVKILSKPKSMPYTEYCKQIKLATSTYAGKLAYYVKLADIKDHLSLTDTLTDRLKEKYLNGLRYLL